MPPESDRHHRLQAAAAAGLLAATACAAAATPPPAEAADPWPWPLALALAFVGLAALAHRWRRDGRAARQALAAANAAAHRQRLAHDDEMRAARGAAQAADRARTRFLAAASHDLRQPAHALGLYLAALREGPLAPAQAEIATRMATSLAALQSMFAALLDVSRLDADALLPRWDLLPLAPLLRRLADEWAGPAEARGLRLALHLPDPAAATVTDAVLLERLLRNLLANAVEHTVSGGVILACRLRSTDTGRREVDPAAVPPFGAAGPARWRIEVWDSGPGIAEADRERVFEEFEQLGGGSDGGFGLGLAIARRLAGLLHLRLRLDSRPGRGSVFFVDGLTPAGPAPLQAAAARQALRRLAGTRVAVIDDSPEVRDATRALLQRWDCSVVDGADAAAVLRSLGARPPPQAVLADLRLAGQRRGADEACTLFAAWGRELPLLLLDSETGTAAPEAPAPAGAACLTKPVSPARLRAWLEQAVAPTVQAPAP